VRSGGNMSLKSPVTPPEIDPGTFPLVAQLLNHYTTQATPVISVVIFQRVSALNPSV